jgi:AhpD family alkylhydroperoxidase
MPLVPLREGSQFDEADHVVLVAAEKAYGQVLNTWAAIANSPGMFAVYLPFLRHLNGPGQLENRIKELTAVRISVLNHCRYTTSHRCTAAAANGATEQELTAVAIGDFSGFTERERLALQLADEMTTELPARSYEQSRTGISEQLRGSLTKLFDARELVEMTMNIGVWNALTRFHRVMDLDLDMPDAPPAVASAL